jgi:hypothetical protein
MSIPGNINQLLIGAAGSSGGDVVGPIKSVRFNSPDSQYLNRTFGTGNRQTFTVSFWVKRVDFDQAVYLLTAGTSTNGYITLDAGQIRFYTSQGDLKTGTDRLFRDASSWYHIVMVADTTNASSDERTRMYINGVQLTNANGDFANYTQPSLDASLGDWNTANTHYINRLTSGSYGNFYMTDHYFIDGQALQASDFGEFDSNGIWKPKLYSGTYGTNGYHLFDFANVTDVGSDSSGNNNHWVANNISSVDGTTPDAPGSSYSDNFIGYYLNGNPPIFLVFDPSGSNRGDSVSHGTNTGTTFALNDVLQWAIDWDNQKVWLGRNNTWYASGDPAGGTNPSASSFSTSYNYYLGIGYDSSDFQLQVPSSATYTPPSGFTYWGGATISTWLSSGSDTGNVDDIFKTAIPKSGKTYIEAKCVGGFTTYATFGLCNFGETITVDDTFRDVCVNHNHEDTGVGGEVSSNYATWNPLTLRLSGSTASLAKGNLHFKTTNSGYAVVVATTAMGPGGKYYCELSFEGTKVNSTNYAWFGIVPSKQIAAYTSGSNDVDLQRALNSLSMSAALNSSRASLGTGSSQNEVDFNASLGYDENDVIGIGVDLDDDILTFYKNGVSFGTFPYTPEAGETYCFFCVDWANGADIDNYILNAGQQAFAYAAPSGFKALCTSSIPNYTIDNGKKHFDTALYTGNGSTQTVSGLEFSPGFVWLKGRSDPDRHFLCDTVRGATKRLQSSETAAEDTQNGVTAFNSDGFDVGNFTENNASGRTYVAWTWDGGSSDTSITVGSLNSTFYDQSEDWSATSTMTTPEGAFDGTAEGSSGAANYSSSGNTLTSSSITINSKLEIYTNRTHTGTQDGTKITINGTDYYDKPLASTGYSEIDLSSATLPLTTTGNILIEDEGGGSSGLWSVRVDGKRLVDSDVTPPDAPSVASTVRANPSTGFSVVTYTGNGTDYATFGHGLNATPEVIIVKRRDSADDWFVYTLPTAGNILNLNNNNAQSSSSHFRNITSSTFQLSGNSDVNHGTGTYVAYCFAPVAGYSSMGYYTGDGTNDGPFINTGFKPAWVMTKSMSAGGDWLLWDSTREPFNYNANTLPANTTDQESDTSGYKIDFVSNGIKFRMYGSSSNGSGVTYTYLIFAENPFKLNGGIAV